MQATSLCFAIFSLTIFSRFKKSVAVESLKNGYSVMWNSFLFYTEMWDILVTAAVVYGEAIIHIFHKRFLQWILYRWTVKEKPTDVQQNFRKVHIRIIER